MRKTRPASGCRLQACPVQPLPAAVTNREVRSGPPNAQEFGAEINGHMDQRVAAGWAATELAAGGGAAGGPDAPLEQPAIPVNPDDARHGKPDDEG